MGKPATKKYRSLSIKTSDDNFDRNRLTKQNPNELDEDTIFFMDMASNIKEEGNKFFQKRDYGRALVKYEKAVKLLPKNHIDTASLHSNLAACYMQMVPREYHKAIQECSLALKVYPKCTKALIKRARCFEALNRLEQAYKDVGTVLRLEPSNITALEISNKILQAIEVKGIQMNDKEVTSLSKGISIRDKPNKKRSNKISNNAVIEEKTTLEKSILVNNAAKTSTIYDEPSKSIKLIFGDDIRFAKLLGNCNISQLREVVRTKFQYLKAVLIKFKDKEGDFVTITTSEELRWAEESVDPQGSLRLYICEVKPEHEPLLDEDNKSGEVQVSKIITGRGNSNEYARNDEKQNSLCCIEEWILKFACLFKSHVGIDSDEYLDLHKLGMMLYSEAMEETVTSEEAMEVFEIALEKFKEMAALALLNLGNVHMSRARRRFISFDNDSKDVELTPAQNAYEWSKREYLKARSSYIEAIKIKSNFYECFFALAYQQFEQAKLIWCFTNENMVGLEVLPSKEVLELFNNAEENMKKGIELWEDMKEKCMLDSKKPNKEKIMVKKIDLDNILKQFSSKEIVEASSNMMSQLHVLWGRILYERSIVEFKLNLPTWEDCLMSAVEKFKLVGASPADISVVVKSHCANETSQKGLGFKIDEIINAWNEMYDAKRWLSSSPSFRLEPLFRSRIPKLHYWMENAC